MKKLLAVIALVMFAGSTCFAADTTKAATPATPATPKAAAPKAATPATPAAPKAAAPKAVVETKTVSGKIATITLADALKGTKSEIVLANSSVKTPLIVTATTMITDADGKVTTLDKLKKDEKVNVKYITKAGVTEATSINLVK